MESLINYFENISSLHRGLILAGGITLFWIIENLSPLHSFRYKKWNHAGINIFFTITTLIVNFTLAGLLLWSANFAYTNNWGLLNFIPEMPVFGYTLIGLLLLDLVGAYFAHWIQHRIPFLWRFHIIHHTDPYIDTTTANRHHPGESIIRFLCTILAILIAGTPMWLVFLYQSLSVVFSQFNHANIQLPKKLDDLISYFIVSPDMHKVHHHYVLPYTDTNYGNIFSIWDRIFGTFSKLPNSEIVYGVDTHQKTQYHSDIVTMLKIPFKNFKK
ncbi:sterol desaturase family protein [Flavobacterium sp.]|uniref:sterol desaturase family protein n=1 Tax=Flavobacterium sp. TaxID=239 RepID=UPI002624121F|nr:sterol desaturase family protein [Flavobacterium sp.]MDD3003644.1 sterol desaturase family protein [Flavobacterium sp.]